LLQSRSWYTLPFPFGTALQRHSPWMQTPFVPLQLLGHTTPYGKVKVVAPTAPLTDTCTVCATFEFGATIESQEMLFGVSNTAFWQNPSPMVTSGVFESPFDCGGSPERRGGACGVNCNPEIVSLALAWTLRLRIASGMPIPVMTGAS